MSKFCHRYDANQSLPRSWTKVTHAGVLRRSYWGGSSTPWKVPSNSPLTIGSPQRSTAGGPHLQVDHYEGMAEDSWGTSEHGAWNTRWVGVALSTPACPPEGQQPPYPYSQGSLTPTPRPAAPCPRVGQPAHPDCRGFTPTTRLRGLLRHR